MKKVELLSKIDAAKHVIAEAEQELARVLADLDQMPRAEKQQISATIQKAFARLHETRTDLVALLGAVKDDEGPIE
jgi:signal transduction histidine kinase